MRNHTFIFEFLLKMCTALWLRNKESKTQRKQLNKNIISDREFIPQKYKSVNSKLDVDALILSNFTLVARLKIIF